VGMERVVANASYVIASNHLSYLDTPVVLANIPVQFRFLAKRGLFKIPFLGGHLKRGGHIPVPREDARAAVRTLTEAGQIIRENGISILVFPEGGRSHDGNMRVFKDGAAFLGIKAGVPILPIAIIGTREVLPFGSGHIRPGRVTLRVGEPIETKSRATRDRTVLTEEIRRQIVAMSERGKA
jgi:1-acyl-sn-glycerol-3-phosphate acyltransferase